MYVYKKMKRIITVGNNPGEKYIAAIANQGTMSSDELLEFIANDTSMSRSDTILLMRSLAEIIEENILAGRGVNFKNLGVFTPNLRTKGSQTIEEVSADNIQQVVVNFRPAVPFRDKMKRAKVEESTKFNLKHE